MSLATFMASWAISRAVILVFFITFKIGAPYQDFIDYLFGLLGDWLLGVFGEGLISSLLVKGVIGGVGSVLTFVPIIFILFFLLSLIEDCGYFHNFFLGKTVEIA